MFRDYYQILGLARNASKEDIRKAYRLYALKLHPDKQNGDKFFEDRFKEINEANDILSDDIKRKRFDDLLNSKDKQTHTNQSNKNQTDFDLEALTKREKELHQKEEALKQKELDFQEQKKLFEKDKTYANLREIEKREQELITHEKILLKKEDELHRKKAAFEITKTYVDHDELLKKENELIQKELELKRREVDFNKTNSQRAKRIYDLAKVVHYKNNNILITGVSIEIGGVSYSYVTIFEARLKKTTKDTDTLVPNKIVIYIVSVTLIVIGLLTISFIIGYFLFFYGLLLLISKEVKNISTHFYHKLVGYFTPLYTLTISTKNKDLVVMTNKNSKIKNLAKIINDAIKQYYAT